MSAADQVEGSAVTQATTRPAWAWGSREVKRALILSRV